MYTRKDYILITFQLHPNSEKFKLKKQDCFRRFAKKKFERDYMERMQEQKANCVSLQAGLRTLHEAGPELKRAISCDLEEAYESDFPSTRR